MSDEILPKSRTEADRESFTRDDNGKVARRVTDDVSHDKLDTIASALGANDTNATIFNVDLPTANVEGSQALPASTKRFILRARNRSQLQIAYTSGDSELNFITLRPGTVFEDPNFYNSQTIYFQSDQAGETVEILAYT